MNKSNLYVELDVEEDVEIILEKHSIRKRELNFRNLLGINPMLYVQKKNFFCKGIILCMTVFLFVPLGVYATSMETQNETIKVAEPTDRTRSKLITDISTSEENGSVSLAITCNTLLSYTSVKPLPLELVLYFPETSLGVAKTEYDIDNAIIGTIKASGLVKKRHSKITIFLKKDLPYRISREGDVVKVVFARGTETETTESLQPEPPIENYLITIIPETLEDKFKMVVHTNRHIEDVKTIALTDPPRIVLDLYGVKSDQKGQQTKIPVNSRWITNVRYLAYPEKVRVVIDTKTEFLTAFTTESLDDGLIVLVGSDIKTP